MKFPRKTGLTDKLSVMGAETSLHPCQPCRRDPQRIGVMGETFDYIRPHLPEKFYQMEKAPEQVQSAQGLGLSTRSEINRQCETCNSKNSHEEFHGRHAITPRLSTGAAPSICPAIYGILMIA